VIESLVRAPLELGLGLVAGIVAGLLCSTMARAPTWFRFGALSALGLVAVLGGWAVGFAGGGSLAAMTMGAVSARRWVFLSINLASCRARSIRSFVATHRAGSSKRRADSRYDDTASSAIL
jgi:hypothetical protein